MTIIRNSLRFPIEDEETGDMRITHVIIPGVPPTGKVVDDLRKVVSSNKLNPRDANSDISSVVKGSLQLNEGRPSIALLSVLIISLLFNHLAFNYLFQCFTMS